MGQISAQRAAQEAAARLSNYEGEEYSYEGDEYSYVGSDDDDVSFHGGARSFVNEASNNVRFSYKIQNTDPATRVVALSPAYFQTAAEITAATGETCDGILTDGVIFKGLVGQVIATALDAKHLIDPMLRFVHQNPTRITEIIIQSNTDASFEEKAVVREVSPWRDLGNNYIQLTDYLDPDQFNQKKVVIPMWRDFENFQMDDQKLILLPIGGTNVVPTTGVILNITYKIGATSNNAAKLAKKARRAYENIDKMRMAGLMG